jgi:hypothetical protein
MGHKILGLMAICGCLLCGCGHANESTYVAPDGTKVTVNSEGGKVNYSDDKGNSVTSTTSGSDVQVKTEKGDTFSMGGSVTEADLGLPFYAGSVEKPAASMKATENGVTSVVSNRTTKDAPAAVVAFYKDKVESPESSNTSANGMEVAMLRGKLKDGSEVTISATKTGSADTEVSVGVKHAKP